MHLSHSFKPHHVFPNIVLATWAVLLLYFNLDENENIFSCRSMCKIHMLRASSSTYFSPSAFCVFVSWMSFWIKLESAPARVGLGITTLLSIVTMYFNIQKLFPDVSYVKVWCPNYDVLIVFTFLEILVWKATFKIDTCLKRLTTGTLFAFLRCLHPYWNSP